MSFEIKGKIVKIIDKSGNKKDGTPFKKVQFVVANNDSYEGAEQIFAFEIFGDEKVDKFNQYNSEGKEVEVSFNVRSNEYNGNYYTSLNAWKVFGVESGNTAESTMGQTPQITPEEEEDILPF